MSDALFDIDEEEFSFSAVGFVEHGVFSGDGVEVVGVEVDEFEASGEEIDFDGDSGSGDWVEDSDPEGFPGVSWEFEGGEDGVFLDDLVFESEWHLLSA